MFEDTDENWLVQHIAFLSPRQSCCSSYTFIVTESKRSILSNGLSEIKDIEWPRMLYSIYI